MTGTAEGADGDPWILVFDGECGFCRRSVDWILERDREGRIQPVPFQSERVDREFRGISRSAFERAMHLFSPKGGVWSGARAGEQILRLLPRWRWIAPFFRIPGVLWVAERVYRLVADHRHRLGCGDHCDLG